MNTYISTYEYNCDMAFNSYDGTVLPILKECVKYIMIDHDFIKRLMPIMYIKVSLTPELYNKMVPEQGKSKIYLNLFRRKKKDYILAVWKSIIYEEFDYFMTDDPNAYKKMDKITNSNGQAYKECVIGLLKLDLQKQNQKYFEGIYKNTNTMSLVQSATSHLKIVIQPFTNNRSFDYFLCPSIPTVGQFIAYINEHHKFYNGDYIYYMDFDRTYLRSNDGSYIEAGDTGELKYVAFDIRDITMKESLATGLIEDKDQDTYIIYVPSNDAQISIDRVTPSLIGEINIISPDGQIINSAKIDTQKITNIPNSNRILNIMSDSDKDAENIKTRIAESSTTLSVTKIDMDSKIFTPNKQYILANYEDNPKYCGIYYMISKKEIYLLTGDHLTCQMTLNFKKCADFSNNKSF